MNFEKTVPEWNAQGAEPPSSLKTSGFQAGYKPPASYFNWFWSKVSACLTELQTKLSKVDNTADAEKSVKYASTSGSANKVKSSMVVRLSGGSTEGTDMFTFDGSAGKSVNITPAKIGAASSTDMPFWATYGTTTNAEIETAYQAGKQVMVKTDDGYVAVLFSRSTNGNAHFFAAGTKIFRCFNGNWADVSSLYTFTPSSHADKHKTGGSDAISPSDIGAAAASHTHDDRYYTESEIDTKLSGKAASSHKHSASDINSGTLGLERGGTGSSVSLAGAPRNAVIRKSNNSDDFLHYSATSDGAFYATSENGSPKFGTLPIAQGGTGATTPAQARANLGAFSTGGGTLTGNVLINKDENPYFALKQGDKTSGYVQVYTSSADASVQRMTMGFGSSKSIIVDSEGSLIITSAMYGTTLPTAGKAGRIFFKKV